MNPEGDDFSVDCEFCLIARGQDSSVEVVGESESWIAFFPLRPATPGHTLIIPRQHVVNLWDIDLDLAAELMKAVVEVGRAIEEAIRPEGMNLITSSGEVAEQTVFHLHLHLVPRWHRDNFGRIWPIDDRIFQDSELEKVAKRIRAAAREE